MGPLRTPGNQTLTATDTAQLGINGGCAVTVIAGIPTSTALSVSATSTSYGQAVTLTATVAVVPPNTGTPNAGTVVFMDGSTSLGSAPVNAGTATLVTTSLPAGQQVVTAYYSGFGSNFADSALLLDRTQSLRRLPGMEVPAMAVTTARPPRP